MKRVKLLLLIFCFISFFITLLNAQQHIADDNTLLLLHFNNSLIGEEGEVPFQFSGITYQPGIFGNGAYFSNTNQLFYSSLNNLNEMQGSMEFWIKPDWNGDDGNDHYILNYGLWGGMLIGKDGGNFWRIILNRWSPSGFPEVGTGLFITDEWLAGVWYHAAFTWCSDNIKVYVNGELRAESPVTVPLSVINESVFQIGAANQDYGHIDAVIDELRISDIVRTDEEIHNSFIAGLSIESIVIEPDTVELLETWWYNPRVAAQTNLGLITFPNSAMNWTSLNSNIATVNENGKIEAVAEGSTIITGAFGGKSDSIVVIVSSPIIPVGTEIIPHYLTTPVENHIWEIPVVIIQFLPTSDGVNIDTDITGWNSSIEDLKDRIEIYNKRVKFMLEEGSRFRGYNNNNLPPSLGYRIVEIYSVYEEIPKSGYEINWNPGWYRPDYYQILTRFNAQNYVNNLGVKEFWIWGYHWGDIEPAESNMSSPVTGDISNSERFEDDLPVFNHTYTVYNYNFTRTQAEAVHNHGHQLESIYKHAAIQQDGHFNLFVHNFSGWGLNYSSPPIGRAGDCHHPPNTTIDYDYENMNFVESDIEDWRPDNTGEKTFVNANTWGNIVYDWPVDVASDIPQKTESQWYIYWMQNMPGFGNVINHGNNYMTNWWAFTADWDSSINNNIGLYGSQPATILPVNIIPDISIESGQTICFNATETVIVAGDGKYFTIESGGHADIIAGHNIFMKEGTVVESGGSLHAYISTTWCSQPENLLAATETESTIAEPIFETPLQNDFFKVYPNPTNGHIILELIKTRESVPVTVEIFNAVGACLLNAELPASNRYLFNLSEKQPGIYLIRVKRGLEAGVKKIVKR